jgi:hypothetical protein
VDTVRHQISDASDSSCTSYEQNWVLTYVVIDVSDITSIVMLDLFDHQGLVCTRNWPFVLRFDKMTLQNAHDAVRVGMVVDEGCACRRPAHEDLAAVADSQSVQPSSAACEMFFNRRT